MVEAARVLRLDDEPPAPFLFTGAETEAQADKLLKLPPRLAEGPILAMAPAADWVGKAWPAERFAMAAAELLGAKGPLTNGRLLLVGGSDDRWATETVRRAIPRDRLVDLMGRADILLAYACLKRARLFIGNDNPFVALATAADVPTLALFGPSDDRIYGPWGPKGRTLRGPRDFAAFKAIDPTFSQAMHHMQDLTTAKVTAAARRLMAETEPQPDAAAQGEAVAETYDLIVRGGEVINHAGRGLADVGVRDGRIVKVGDLGQASAGEVFDAAGLTVMPGVIDTQVHFREPGLEWKEDLETGSRAAVLGGVATVFEMPNTQPTTTDPEALADKLARAAGRMHTDHAFYVGGTHENAHLLGELERLPGCCGVKVFMGASTGSLLVPDDPGVTDVLRHTHRRATFHSEDEYRLPSAVPWPARATGPAMKRSATPPRRSAPPSGWCGSPANSASASMSCTSPPPTRSSSWPVTRTWPPSR